MGRLITEPNIDRPDDVYQRLIDLHEGCDDAESQKRNAKLILCLVNHVGDIGVINEAIALAGGGTGKSATQGEPS